MTQDQTEANPKKVNLTELFGLIAIPLVGVLLLVYQIIAGINNRQHEIMAQYLDQMTQLLTEGDLNTDTPNLKTKMAARAITINAARQLNSERKGQLLRFLYESGLIGKCEVLFDPKTLQPSGCSKTAIVQLETAKLEGTKPDIPGKSLVLPGAILSSVDLTGANLQDVGLSGSIMEGTTLKSANLRRAILEGADMKSADLSNANLAGAKMNGTNLSSADLSEADLSCIKDSNNKTLCANLTGATLDDRTKLERADLRGANLNTNILILAKLNGAKYDDQTIFPPEFDETQRIQRGMINVTESSVSQSVISNKSAIQSMTNCSFTLSYCVPISR